MLAAAALAAATAEAAPERARSAAKVSAKAPSRRPLPPPVQVDGPRANVPGRTFRGRLHQPAAAARKPIRYETASGHIMFPVEVDGRKAWALLDSGAGNTLIDLNFARSIGTRLEALPSVTQTASDGTALPGTLAPDVTIVAPDQFDTRLALVAVDLGNASRALGRPIGVVIGSTLLGFVGVRIDPIRRELGFVPKGTKPGSDFSAIPLRDGKYVDVSIGRATARLAVDTGSDGAISLTSAAWSRTGETSAPLGTTSARGAGAGVLRGFYTIVPQARIGPFNEAFVQVDVAERPTAAHDGTVGMGLLRRFTMLLDVGGGTLWLKPNGIGIAPPTGAEATGPAAPHP